MDFNNITSVEMSDIQEMYTWKNYKMMKHDYQNLYDKQDHKCSICRCKLNHKYGAKDIDTRYGERVHIDHCHSTNIVRGLLCPSCNVAIGFFEDDVDSLRRAVDYLITSQSITPENPIWKRNSLH